ncbi:hypothetical protein [Hymenobacter sp. PAMC 26628]|uniref:hypothetical protein n=1 Tax=Hymenobacter sp. PAMC 26628 TaxID=1484118 RepID=UPI000ABF900C|nr:hypothetical protein [Hymenobacter sp. PAMC 26628]
MRTRQNLSNGSRLAIAAAVVFLVGCKTKQPVQIQIPAPESKTMAASVLFVMPTAMTNTVIRDSIGPLQLAWQQVDLLGMRAAPESGMKIDTLLGRFLEVREVEQAPRLFYKSSSVSNTWIEIDMALPELDGDHWRSGNVNISLDTANLDSQGGPEILVTAETYSMGSGSGGRWVYKAVLDISNKPILLLRGWTEVEDERHGEGSEGTLVDELDVICGREVVMRNHEIVVGPIKKVGKPDSTTCATLTALPLGRYRYQNGKVMRVGK